VTTTAVRALASASPVADVADAFVAAVIDAFRSRAGSRFALVLSGGPTAQACYERLAADRSGSIDWSVVDIYIGDERVVPPDDQDANQRLVREALVDPVGPVGSFRPMPTVGMLADCVAEYQVTVAGVLAGPGFDLVHLGLGPDGHTASLFPGAPTLTAPPNVLVASTEDPNGRNPHPRMTLTLPAINQARQVVFTVGGSAKKDAVAQVREGLALPGAQVDAARVDWLIDHEAFG